MRILDVTLLAPLTALFAFSLPALADSERPSAVSQISASAQSGPAITLSWETPDDNVGVVGFNLYRNNGYFTTVYGRTNYTDTEISAGSAYEYYVVAFDEARNYSTTGTRAEAVAGGSNDGSNDETNDRPDDNSSSGPSTTEPTADGKPAAPTGLDATLNGTSVTLTWNTPSGGAEGFNIYKDGSYYSTVKDRNDYTDSSLSSGRSYSYEVTAFRNNLFSSSSSSVTVNVGSSGGSTPETVNPPPVNDAPSNPTPAGGGNSAVPDNYNLVFSDEFNGSSVDSSKWNTSYRWGADFIINSEEQYYVDTQRNSGFGVNPFRFDGSGMTIQATVTPDNLRNQAAGQRYLSGALTTFNKFRMTYGYVEMRAKMPSGFGLWPAFWLLHQGEDNRRPEIDVVEMLGRDTNVVYQTYHYFEGSNLRSSPSYQARGSNFANDFHTYGMLWEPGKITWYVDGVETNSHSGSSVSNESMYILVNLAMGGSWAGSPNSSTPFPANFEIDYIRAYQR